MKKSWQGGDLHQNYQYFSNHPPKIPINFSVYFAPQFVAFGLVCRTISSLEFLAILVWKYVSCGNLSKIAGLTAQATITRWSKLNIYIIEYFYGSTWNVTNLHASCLNPRWKGGGLGSVGICPTFMLLI